jgi:three-Cys-motif partner protein
MSDTLPTIWEGSAHTFAKHQILETYLKAWMPIMSRQSRKLGISESHRIKSIKVKGDDCETVLNEFLNSRRSASRNIGPAFFFLDQFGFSNVSMQLIQRIMSQPYCEVFSYLNWDHMNRFLTDETKWASLDRTFGGSEWRPALKLEWRERSIFMLKTYKTALKMLEDDSLLKVTNTPAKRRRGTFSDKYADQMQLDFVSDGLTQA